MKQIKTLLAALFVAMAGTASAQTKNYVHITKTDGTKVHFSQDEIESMIIDTEGPEELKFVTFTDGTNTVTVANMNLGATSVAKSPETCYGDYYAWGATETFGTVSYTAYNAGTVTATKEGGYTQANAPADFADVVTAKMGTGYHMPTRAEIQVLYNACGGTGISVTPSSISDGAAYAQGIYWVAGATSAVTIGGDEYKANGVLFVQDADTHVFFPAAGYVSGTTLNYAGNIGYSWSSSLYTGNTDFAYRLYFKSDRVSPGNDNLRYFGMTVRPFKDAAPAPAPEPDYVEFTSGTNTVKVAKMNLGATTVADSPETSYGNYYAWGATSTSTEYTYANAPYWNGSAYTKYTGSSDATLEAADDAVAANMTGWHMPTETELQTLFAACGGSNTPTGTISANRAYPTTAGIYWVTGGSSAVKIGDDTYSVNGMLFVQDADTHVFFPAAGYVYDTYLDYAGEEGYYWSSSLLTNDTDYAYYLYFYSSIVHPGYNNYRYYGYPVRPFKD